MDSGVSLTKQQKESIFLLQIGTFLEYFDLMLYIHMVVLLNDLFFPPTDQKTASLLAALAFCSTYVLRPVGALIFGYIGDNYGRKPTVIITTTLMATCCLIMSILPTYNEIGIKAAVIVSMLRIIQGMSSMGEVMGARIYITEITKPPIQYPSVSFITIASVVGSMSALGVAALVTRTGFNWRYAFGFGAIVAIIGIVARTKLRETPEFANAKLKMHLALESLNTQGLAQPAKLLNNFVDPKLNIRNFGRFCSIYCGWPLCFYLSYIYFVPTLKSACGYTNEDIIVHNLYLVLFEVIAIILWTFLSYRIYPLLIAKYRGMLFLLIMTIIPFLVTFNLNQYQIFIAQILIVTFGLSVCPTDAILIKHFPVFKRFTAATFGYAFANAVMYVIISFGLVYLTEWFGFYGIWIITFPVIFFWLSAIYYYESIEKECGLYPKKGQWQV